MQLEPQTSFWQKRVFILGLLFVFFKYMPIFLFHFSIFHFFFWLLSKKRNGGGGTQTQVLYRIFCWKGDPWLGILFSLKKRKKEKMSAWHIPKHYTTWEPQGFQLHILTSYSHNQAHAAKSMLFQIWSHIPVIQYKMVKVNKMLLKAGYYPQNELCFVSQICTKLNKTKHDLFVVIWVGIFMFQILLRSFLNSSLLIEIK